MAGKVNELHRKNKGRVKWLAPGWNGSNKTIWFLKATSGAQGGVLLSQRCLLLRAIALQFDPNRDHLCLWELHQVSTALT